MYKQCSDTAVWNQHRYTSTYPIKLLWEYRVRLIILSSKNRGVDLRETQVMQMNHDITIQDVFHRFLPKYCETHNLSPQQQLTALCISKCHTLEMGANLSECESCHKKYIHYNSCKNRHCPMCQGMEVDEWIDKQQENVLDVPYFHTVFTVLEELYSLI